jgi:TRAP-type C4-dicarboxylate transport system permease small subunit
MTPADGQPNREQGMPAALRSIVSRLSSGLALVGAAAVVAMLLHVVVYVVMRHVASAPVPATIEIVSYYYMVAIAFLPVAWAERRGDMITVEVFESLFPPAVRRWNAALVSLICFCAYCALTYTTWTVAMREFAAGSFVISLNVALPTWPGYFALPAGFGLAALVSLFQAVDAALGGSHERHARDVAE